MTTLQTVQDLRSCQRRMNLLINEMLRETLPTVDVSPPKTHAPVPDAEPAEEVHDTPVEQQEQWDEEEDMDLGWTQTTVDPSGVSVPVHPNGLGYWLNAVPVARTPEECESILEAIQRRQAENWAVSEPFLPEHPSTRDYHNLPDWQYGNSL